MERQGQEADLPVWRRERIFPPKPTGAPYGVLLGKNEARTFNRLEELGDHVSQWKQPADLIWTPDHDRCFPPEEDPRLLGVLRKRKSALADDRWSSARYRAFLLILPIVYFLWVGLANGQNLLRSQNLGLFAVLWLMFAGIPAYEAWRRKNRATRLNTENLSNEALEVRFEIWLYRQPIPLTKVILGSIVGVFIVQIMKGIPEYGSLTAALLYPSMGVQDAGLIKVGSNGTGYFNGEWWRLLTAPMLHGQLIHIVMNGLGFLYLGRRTEVMAGWPHLAIVFLISMLAGGIASAYGLPTQPSVGASGGILGLLGFLLVFELLHGKLVPRTSTRRLSAALIFTFVVGFVGYNLIDNWAHGGGLLAGMAYGDIVFPKSRSPHRPRATVLDRFLGAVSAAVILAGALLAVLRMRGL